MKSFAILLAIFWAHPLLAVGKPNVLIIMADDCTFNDLPLDGGKNARTPPIDALADGRARRSRCGRRHGRGAQGRQLHGTASMP